MPFIGNQPAKVPLTSADITDGIITNADIANSTINLTTKVTGSLPVANGGTGLTALGSASQVLRVNSGATALEYATPATGSYVFLASGTASNVSTLDINGYFTSSYDVYKIFIYDCYAVTQDNLRIRVATTGSYTVQTGSDYYGTAVYARRASDSATLENPGEWGGTSMQCILGVGTTSSAISNAEITIFNPLSTTVKKKINVHSNGIEGNITVHRSMIGTEYWNNTTAITGLRFFLGNNSNFYGTFKLYGIKNS